MKRIASIVILSLLMLIPYAKASAEEEGQGLPYFVSDAAGILSTEDWQKLEYAAEEVSNRYQCGIYIITVDDYKAYTGSSVRACAEAFYQNYNMGIGESRNGSLLFLSMKDRDYSLIAYGSDAHTAFTDYAKDWVSNRFLDDFRNDDWADGFSDYISGCENILSRAAAGSPMDVSPISQNEERSSTNLLITIFAPLLASFGICQGMKRKMKPVRNKSTAEDYIVPGGIDLKLKRDVFLNRTVTRTVIRNENRDSGSHGGGFHGGTTISSSGFSGHSGKF